jgi:hypothetical protein
MTREMSAEKRIGQLLSRTELGSKMFNHLLGNGHLVDIDIDSSTWESRSNWQEKSICLGTARQDSPTAERLVFGNLSREEAMIHRFNHEMAHLFLLCPTQGNPLDRGTPVVQQFMRSVDSVRRAHSYKKGLSAVGSMSFYNDGRKPHEDAAELIAMRLRSRSYLGAFANYISNPAHKDTLDRIGVAQTPESVASAIVKQVDTVVKPALHAL